MCARSYGGARVLCYAETCLITISATQRMSRPTEDAAASVTELREQEAIEWRRVKEQAQGLERLMRCDPNRHIL